jgi:hypothetical protein
MQTYYDHQVGRFEARTWASDRDLLLARARRARAEATAELFGALFRRAAAAARGVFGLIRPAGRGAAPMRPHHATPVRLTGGCD